MKRRGPAFEHALGRQRARVLDSESLSALRRFIALAHYASVGGPGHSNCLLCQEAIRERARQQQLVRRQAYGQEPAVVQGTVQGAVQVNGIKRLVHFIVPSDCKAVNHDY